MRLLCIISSLEPGGAERVMSWLTEGLAKRGHGVMLACLAGEKELVAQKLPEGVELRFLGLRARAGGLLQALGANFRRVQSLRRLMREVQPGAVVSFLDRTNVLVLAAAQGLRLPVIVAEHTDPARASLGPFWSFARRVLYGRAARILVLSDAITAFFGPRLRLRVLTMPNPLLVPDQDEGDSPCIDPPLPGRHRLLAVGRLDRAKRYDLLIRAFADLQERHPSWDLRILGDGPLRSELEALIAQRSAGDRIQLPGWSKDPFPAYRGSEALAITSEREGFPMVLAEAMAFGVPVLSTNCGAAIPGLLNHGEAGLLVDSNSLPALSAGLDRLLGDAALRERLRAGGLKAVRAFDPERILDAWEHLLADPWGTRP